MQGERQDGTVVLITTGGTIGSGYDPAAGDVRVTTAGSTLLDAVRARLPEARLEVVDLMAIGSFALDLDTAFRLVCEIRQVLERDEVCGVVVTHGTDTMEETAYLADLTIASDKPVVLTGAQRQHDDPDGDGPRNLAGAVQVAMSAEARGLGTMIVFADEAHAARDVTKTHTSRLETFQSGELGKLGDLDRGRFILRRRPAGRRTFACAAIETRVDLIKLAMGSDDRFIEASLQSGVRGLVIEAFGRGNVTPAVLGGVERAIGRGVPVLITSRCRDGHVAPIYGKSGGAGLAAAGAIFAGDLRGVKARILLSVLLGAPGPAEPLAEVVASLVR